jgi:hypothetical protein
VPGATAAHSFVSAGQPRVEVQCRNCGFVRRHLMPRSAPSAASGTDTIKSASLSEQAIEKVSTELASDDLPVAPSVPMATVETASATVPKLDAESMADSR